MCQECGCGLGGNVKYSGDRPGAGERSGEAGGDRAASSDRAGESLRTHTHHHAGHGHGHDHDHDHGHGHGPDAGHEHPPAEAGMAAAGRVLSVQRSLLERNERWAEQNRGYFRAKRLFVVNVLSAPGSGKTTFIQKTAEQLRGRLRIGVIVGDLATDCDAARLREVGLPVVQITTGTLCHLEAEMIARAAEGMDLDAVDLLIIENVGNLVCPASYDLGENLRVVLLSVTEGEDKPLKYPPMFHSADVAIVSKTDLASATGFARDAALANLHRISHHAAVFETSARTGQGMEQWCAFLEQRRREWLK